MIQRTGILGGTFDPVHKGHLALAAAAARLCSLDEIVLLPAAVPPHKQEQSITEFSHRVAMLELAVRKQPFLQVSTVEQLLPSPSYTIDTLHYLRMHSPHPLDFFFITGADTFLDILSWKEHQELLGTSNFVVFLRSGSSEDRLNSFLDRLGYDAKEDYWYHDSLKKRVYTSTDPLPAFSSSAVRKGVEEGGSVEHMLPAGVFDYIVAHHLYSAER